ncbi:MAG: tRNA epoxyqueuosine(34) reductase QueG [Waddliaceae bacterium]|nr:tRNA epoxyqueuosine(34) reductase QueG [Waddliaceae bacterium]
MKPITLDELKEKAFEFGWDDMGSCKAEIPASDISFYLSWIKHAFHGELHYMEKEMRCYPQEILPGAKTAIIFLSHYKQEHVPFFKNKGVVASYARHRDYHNVHRKRLKRYIRWLEERSGQEGIARGFSDSKPVLEKALAVQAGLGWMGKNSLLIHRKFGTFTLLSGIFTTLELPIYLGPDLRKPKCGTCTRCLDACPTKAIVAPYTVNASKCLSYHLIESKGPVAKEASEKNPGYIFGCDICQDVCPHNVRPPLASHPDFTENGVGAYLTESDIDQFIKEPERLYGTPLNRRGASGLKHSAQALFSRPLESPPSEDKAHEEF